MTAPPVTIEPEQSLTAAADRMLEYGVSRLPVTRDGALVGIVTRHDLLAAFMRDDEALAREIRESALSGLRWPQAVKLDVAEGRVRLNGHVDNPADAKALPAAVRHVLGVVSVDAELTAWDHRREGPVVVSVHL